MVKGILDRNEKLMGFGHRVYRAEDPRARVLRATAKRLEAPRYEVAAALEQAALAELRERRPDRAIETNVEFWAAVILDFAAGAGEDDARDVHLRAHRGLVRAHPRAEAARQAGPPVGHLRRPRPAQPRVRRGLGPSRQVVTVRPIVDIRLGGTAVSPRSCSDIPARPWDGPGLGEWDLRSLVGHASRSLITVSTYLQTTAEREDIATPQEYYARVNPDGARYRCRGVVERGRQAGRDLGDDPAATVDGLVSRVLGELRRRRHR